MKKILWIFGDSYADGLIKIKNSQPIRNSPEERRNIRFSTQIMNMTNIFTECKNLSYSGSSNEMIGYAVNKNLQNISKNDFVLICLSHAMRLTYYDPVIDDYRFTGQSEQKFSLRNPIWQTDMIITFLHHSLRQKNVKHLFINSFEPTSIYSAIDFSVLESYNYYKPEYKDNTLLDILLGSFCENKAEKLDYLSPNISYRLTHTYVSEYITECNHPTPKGHVLIAKTLIPIIEERL